MANIGGNRIGSNDLVCEELVPYSAWTEDSSSHYLLVDLPGFKKEQLKLQINNQGDVLVSGERQTGNNRIVQFTETLKIPKNSDHEKISAKYEGEVLYVIVPKQVKDDQDEKTHRAVTFIDATESHNGKEVKQDKDTHKESLDNKNTTLERLRDRFMRENDLLNSATEILSKNKGIIITAVLAFSLGVLLSQKFQSSKSSEGTYLNDPVN